MSTALGTVVVVEDPVDPALLREPIQGAVERAARDAASRDLVEPGLEGKDGPVVLEPQDADEHELLEVAEENGAGHVDVSIVDFGESVQGDVPDVQTHGGGSKPRKPLTSLV